MKVHMKAIIEPECVIFSAYYLMDDYAGTNYVLPVEMFVSAPPPIDVPTPVVTRQWQIVKAR